MNRPLLWLLLACLLGAGGLYAWSKAIPYDEVVDHGPSPEALANPTSPPNTFCVNKA
jgi:hypothetical protein